MKKFSAEALFFWLGLLTISCLVMVRPVHADTIPATQTQLPQWCVPTNGWCASTTRHTKAETCSVINSYWPSNAPYSPVDTGGAYGFGFCDSAVVGATDPAINQAGTWTSYTCPSGYNLDAGGTTCTSAVVCPAAGTTAGAYWINTGTVPDSIYTVGNGQFCNNGCLTSSFVTMPRPAGYPVEDGATKIVNGVRQYYSFREYQYTGGTCTGNTQAASITPPTQDTCAAGQSVIQMGSRFQCLNPATGQLVNTNSASAVAAAKTLADSKTADKLAAAASAVAAAGGSASDVMAARTVAAGVAAAGGASGGAASSDPVQAAFCSANPDASICKASSVAAHGFTGALPDTSTGWYTKKYPDGIGGVMTANFNTMKNTPLAGLINGLVPTFSGAAHNGCFTVPIWNMGNQVICVPPLVMTALGIFMLLTALFTARALVFGG